jgi:hypothetical protein
MKLLSFLCIFILIFPSCKQELQDFNTLNNKKLEVESTLLVDKENLTFKSFLNSTSYEIFKRNFSSKAFGIVKLVRFKNSNSIALSIELKENFTRGINQSELIVAIPDNDPNLMVPFIVTSDIQSNNQGYTGSVTTFDASNQMIAQLQVVNSAIGGVSTYNPISPASDPMSVKWNCTYAQYKAHYRYFKNACEEDPLCDVVCAFTGGSCNVSYAISAAVMCTSN